MTPSLWAIGTYKKFNVGLTHEYRPMYNFKKFFKLVAWIPWIAFSECVAPSFLRVMHPSTMSKTYNV